MSKLANLKITEITESPVALRAVDTETEAFKELVDSIRAKGVINPVSVRPLTEGGYCLIDGLHRFTAAKAAGLAEIPCQILEISEVEAMEAQLVANIQKVETRPVEYAKHLKRILATNPLMTLSELAQKVAKSAAWISDRFGLLKLAENVQTLVDSGEVGLSNAYALSRLPNAEQLSFLDRAMTLPPAEFIPLVEARMKELRQAKREGTDGVEEQFVAVPHLRKLSELKAELENGSSAAGVCADVKAKKSEDGFKACLNWVLQLDPKTVKEKQEKFEARKKMAADERNRRTAERAEKAAAAAAKKAADLQAEADKAKADVSTKVV